MDKYMLPPLSVDLIDMLDEELPERCPSKQDSMEDIMYYAGARSVVRKLLAMKKEAEEEGELI